MNLEISSLSNGLTIITDPMAGRRGAGPGRDCRRPLFDGSRALTQVLLSSVGLAEAQVDFAEEQVRPRVFGVECNGPFQMGGGVWQAVERE